MSVKRFYPYILIIGICLTFFYKTIFYGKIPFPGDLLLAEDAPWRHASYFGYNPGSIPNKAQYFDVIQEIYPWKTLVINELKKGHLPLWNPYNFSGTPLLANYQSQVFSPINIIFFIFPQWLAWTISVILQPIIGGIFMYLYMKKIGKSDVASMIASIAFNFSGFASTWMEFSTIWHTILWLPFFLYLIEDVTEKHQIKPIHVAGFSLGVFISITAGHPQDFINTMLFTCVYLFSRTFILHLGWKEKILRFLGIGWPIFLGLGLGGIQLLPTVELYSLSSRVNHDLQNILTSMLFQWWQTPMLIVQDFFGNPATKSYIVADTYVGKTAAIGSAGTILAIAALFAKKSWHKYFYLIVIAFMIIISINSPITSFIFRYPIPLLSTGTPTRNLFLFSFALSVLAGIGYDTLVSLRSRRLLTYLGVIGVVFGVLWILGIFLTHLGLPFTSFTVAPTKRAMLLASFFVGMALSTVIAGEKWPKILPLLLLIVSLELGVSFNKFNPFVPPSYVYPNHPIFSFLRSYAGINRFWGYGSGYINANFATQESVFATDGVDPLNIKSHNEFLRLSETGKFPTAFDRASRSDATIKQGYGELELAENPYRLRILDITGTAYIFTHSDTPTSERTFPEDRFARLTEGVPDGWSIFKNLKAADRFFLTDSHKTYDSEGEFEKILFSESFNPQKDILIKKTDALTIKTAPARSVSAQLLHYGPTEVIIQTRADADQLLYLSDTYTPGWQAYIDGKNTPILRANYAYRAVGVPKGNHTVRFLYAPTSFTYGLYSTLGSLIALFVTLIGTKLHQRTDTIHTL